MTLEILWTADRVVAVIAGAILCAYLYFFFFGRRRAEMARTTEGQTPQEATIVVSGGYEPDLVVAKKGVPLRLVFDRREDSPCSDEVVLPEFELRQQLAPFAKTAIEVVPRRAGEFPFSCGMNMLHGTIRVLD